ncbi:MAG: CDP-diacylglycerol--glycerol-3-phosphate 3-phosphatidyltransferase [Pseudomonadota bacterium]
MTFATLLTFSRIALVPVLFILFTLRTALPLMPWIILGVFIIAALTDYFDGVVARTYRQSSKLGRLFDPIADKMLVIALLFMLAGYGHLDIIGLGAALIIILREILVSGMRQFVAQGGGEIEVSALAKWKTATQMVAIGMAIVAPVFTSLLPMGALASITFAVAAILTVITGWQYTRHTLALLNKDAL